MTKVQPADVKLTSSLLKTFQTTLPLLLTDDEDCCSAVNFGELLFPNFNHLVVQMCEQMVQFDETLLAVFAQMLTFAFKTQIFEVHPLVKSKPLAEQVQKKRPHELEYSTLPKRLQRKCT